MHLWAGLATGLYIFVSAVSGSALVFHEELGRLAQSRLRTIPAAEVDGRRLLTLDEARAAVVGALPDHTLLSIAPPPGEYQPFEAGLFRGRYRLAFVHPATGAVIGPVEAGGPVLSWLHELHANLLSGRTGRWVNGIGGGMLFLLCVTGIVIWWPGGGKWARSMTVDRRAGWKRQVFDLHNATGFWLLIPVALFAITGSYFTWPQQYRAAIASLSPLTPADPPKSDVSRRGASGATLEGIVAQARERQPGARVVRVAVPGRVDGPYTVFMAGPGTDAPHQLARYFFDQHTGALLGTRPPGISGTAGDRIAGWIGPLHTGHFGGPLVKTLYVIVGLAPAVLFATGLIMWWNRVVTRRWREAWRTPRETMGPWQRSTNSASRRRG